MFTCPNCQLELVRGKTADGFFYVCPKCHGRSGAVAVLRRAVGEEAVRQLWREVKQEEGAAGKSCPICRRPTREVAVCVPSGEVRLDVCAACHFLWFDPDEFEKFPLPPDAVALERQMPVELREKMAVAEMGLVAQRERLIEECDGGGPAPLKGWRWMAVLFRLLFFFR